MSKDERMEDIKKDECCETESCNKAEEAECEDNPEETLEEVVEEVLEETEEDDLNGKYLRLMADFQNYKKRKEKERADTLAYANEKIVGELLTVMDNFERALKTESEDSQYVEGMELIFKQLQGVLEKSGLEEIDAHGKEFDLNFHNAVMTEDNDDFESGHVTEVFQKGYTLNGKVIRPSMVKVNN